MIKFRCPSCQTKLGVPDEYVNRRVKCNQCGQACVVPKPIARVPAQPSPEEGSKSTAAAANNQPAKIQLQRAPQPQSTDQLEFIDDSQMEIQDDPNAAILRQLQKEKASKQKITSASAKPTRQTSVKAGKRERGGSDFSLTEIVPDALHFPLSLVLGLLATGAFIVIWIVAAQKTQNPLTFFTMLIPWAAAAGIRLLAVNRTFALGTLAAVIGVAGIGLGRVVVAKTVIVPLLHKQADQEVLVDLKTILADPEAQIPPNQSAKFIANDGALMTCVALITAVDQDNADPVVARKLAMDILVATKKTDFLGMIEQAGTGAASIEASRSDEDKQYTDKENEVMDKAGEHLSQWEEDAPRLSAARKYYPALSKLMAQCKLQRMISEPQQAFHFALLMTLGLLDVAWLLAGFCGAYVLAAFDI